MLFSDIIGQGDIKNKLIKTVKEQRISHAQMFLGDEGYGSLALALAYARFISCTGRGETDSCGICSSCRKYSKLEHPDLHFVLPVVKLKGSDKDPVSDDFISLWRETLIESPYIHPYHWYEKIGVDNKQGAINKNESQEILRKLSLKTFESAYKIMIIWRPEKMNVTAANKLLKLLEEPYPDTLFILVTVDTSQMLPTVISRSQIIRIPPIDNQSMEKALRKITGIQDGSKTDDIVRLSVGNYIKALSFIRENEQSEFFFNHFVKLMRICYAADLAELAMWVDNTASLGRERQKHFLKYSTGMIRENFMLNVKANDIVYLSDKEREFSSKFSRFINSRNVVPVADEIKKASIHIENNAYGKTVLFDMGLKLAKLLKN